MNRHLPFSLLFVVFICSGCKVAEPARIQGPFDAYLREMAAKEHFSGVALIMREGKILHARGYGTATAARANAVDTRFHVASITKQFTAAAIMQLAEQGMVKLDGSINTYLPAGYRSPTWDAVTVHQLLSHTSGIPDYAVTRDYYHLDRGFALDDTVDGMLKEAMGKDLEFLPGSRYAYSNLGYTLLGSIVENLTGISYAEFVKRNLLEPMGMMSSSVDVAPHVPADDEAQGLRWNDELAQRIPDDAATLPATAPDGGLITTLEDFAKWTRMLSGGEQSILSQDSIRLMSTPHVHIGNGGPLDSMGYGLFVGDRLTGHGGLIVGFRSQFILDRETRSVIAVFSNDASNDAHQVALGLLTLLLTADS